MKRIFLVLYEMKTSKTSIIPQLSTPWATIITSATCYFVQDTQRKHYNNRHSASFFHAKKIGSPAFNMNLIVYRLCMQMSVGML